MSKRICMVVTSADKMSFKDGSGEMPTGLWCEEAAAPYNMFKKAGFAVVFASPKGGKITMDEGSLKGDFFTAHAKEFQESEEAQQALNSSITLAEALENADSYDAVFLAGGHGTCTDFVDNGDLKALLEKVHGRAVIAAVCHGPQGLCNVNDKDGNPIVKGHAVAGFSDVEEGPGGVNLAEKVPFSLEQKLIELGGKYEKADPWNSKVCVSGKLITGQNPQSSEGCASSVIELLA